jgi:hypothetical protein
MSAQRKNVVQLFKSEEQEISLCSTTRGWLSNSVILLIVCSSWLCVRSISWPCGHCGEYRCFYPIMPLVTASWYYKACRRKTTEVKFNFDSTNKLLRALSTSFIICTFRQVLFSERCVQYCGRKTWREGLLGRLGVDRKVILKWISGK